RDGEATRFEGANVDCANAADTALVCGGRARCRAGIYRRTAGQQCHRLRRPAVVCERGEQRNSANQIISIIRDAQDIAARVTADEAVLQIKQAKAARISPNYRGLTGVL